MSDDIQRLRNDLLKLADGLVSQKLLNRIGLAGIRRIKDRTRRGVDFEEQPFQEYSPGHAKRRAEKGLPTELVNLEFSIGADLSMMDSPRVIDHVVSRDLQAVAIQFNDAEKEQLARYHNELGAGKSKVKRRFFELSEQDGKDISELVETDIQELLSLLDLT